LILDEVQASNRKTQSVRFIEFLMTAAVALDLSILPRDIRYSGRVLRHGNSDSVCTESELCCCSCCCCYNRNTIHIASAIFYFLSCSIFQLADIENSGKEDDILRYYRVVVWETAVHSDKLVTVEQQ
jgi:hypothetical protein